MKKRGDIVVLPAIFALILIVVLGGGSQLESPAFASWTEQEFAQAGYAAGQVIPATSLTCTPGFLAPATFSWTTPLAATPANRGVVRTGYRWRLLNGAQAVVATGTASAAATFVSLAAGLLTIGTYSFTVAATGTGPWESTSLKGTVSFVSVISTSCSVP